jgi:hypothetical protein
MVALFLIAPSPSIRSEQPLFPIVILLLFLIAENPRLLLDEELSPPAARTGASSGPSTSAVVNLWQQGVGPYRLTRLLPPSAFADF